MKKITEELLRDAFIDLTDNGWITRIGSEHYVVHSDGEGESGKTISHALKNFLQRKKVDQVECNKQIIIHISRPNNNVLNFKEYKDFQQDFLGCLGNFCDEIGVDEDKVSVENGYGVVEYTISIIQDMFMINNINKFIIIQKIFNTKFNGKISIGLYDDGIKLNWPGIIWGGEKWIEDNKSLYDDAIQMIKKDFDIEKKDNFIYLHPKFEFIKNENI